MNKESLTQQHLKEILHYDPETGIFTWLNRRRELFDTDKVFKIWNTNYARKIAGSINSVSGYRLINISGIRHRAHRLAFLYVTGGFPENHVDHENHDRDDNRWINLKDVTQQENNKNSLRPKDNTSGFSGVHWFKAGNKWQTYINLNRKRVHLGYFADLDEAIMARKEAEIKYGYHPNHGKAN